MSHKSVADCTMPVTDPAASRALSVLQWLEVLTKLKLTTNMQIHLQGDVCRAICTKFTESW